MPLASGTVFAGYTILRLLDSGGMGEVYLAHHPRLQRRDALKILPREITADSEFRERFDREADLAAALWHPNSSGSTTAANSTASCGSRWTTSKAPTPGS
jgi:serine/threonine-protein kinase